MSLRTCSLLALILALFVACGGEEDSAGGVAASDAPIEFATTVAPFEGFSYSTGQVPKSGAAQVSLAASAKGDLSIAGIGDVADGKIVGRKGTGKLSLDGGFVLDGNIKLDAGVAKYDGDLPGLKDASLPLVGATTFDPFILGSATELTVAIPKTDLPPIRLGATPAKLMLTITEKSELHATFAAACLEVQAGAARWKGSLSTTGSIVLSARVEVDLPGAKPIELGEIEIPIALPAMSLDVAAKSAGGAADATEGTCGAGPATSGGETTAEPSSPQPQVDGGSTPTDDAATPKAKSPLACSAPVFCADAQPLGTIRGDIGADVLTAKGNDTRWFKIHVDEGSTESRLIGAELEFVYDTTRGVKMKAFLLHADQPCSQLATATSGLSAAGWGDRADFEDGRDLYVVVINENSNPAVTGSCSPWSLKITRKQ